MNALRRGLSRIGINTDFGRDAVLGLACAILMLGLLLAATSLLGSSIAVA